MLSQSAQLKVFNPDYALLNLPIGISVEVVSLRSYVANNEHLALLLDHLHVVVVKAELVGQHEVGSLEAHLVVENLLTPLVVVYVEAAQGL